MRFIEIKPPRRKVVIITFILITNLLFTLFGFLIHISYAQSCSLFTVGFGLGGVFDDEQLTYSFIEYRPAYYFNILSPWITLEKAEKELYIGMGLLFDIKLNDCWIFTPSFGVGYYDHNEGVDLGSLLEFRSSFEIARPFNNKSRLGVGFGHYSNANLGYRNPGLESLRITYSIPF
ncbi:MAG: acyloxyacyl hydrolase [bacterium]